LYKDNFDLEILEEKEIYKVNLSIPLWYIVLLLMMNL
jgi:hypothetical protein